MPGTNQVTTPPGPTGGEVGGFDDEVLAVDVTGEVSGAGAVVDLILPSVVEGFFPTVVVGFFLLTVVGVPERFLTVVEVFFFFNVVAVFLADAVFLEVADWAAGPPAGKTVTPASATTTNTDHRRNRDAAPKADLEVALVGWGSSWLILETLAFSLGRLPLDRGGD